MSRRDDERKRRRRRYEVIPVKVQPTIVYRPAFPEKVVSGNNVRRDAFRIASLSILPDRLPSQSPRPRSGRRYEVEDRRTFRPEIVPPLRGRRSVPGVVAAPRGRVRFRRGAVMICERREERRQVMFAKGKGGRRGQRPPRYNRWSHISCRRRS